MGRSLFSEAKLFAQTAGFDGDYSQSPAFS